MQTYKINCHVEDGLIKLLLSSASYGPVLQSDGENHKGEENYFQDSLYVAGCDRSTMGKLHTRLHA